MKAVFLIPLLMLALSSDAATYYVDFSAGSDAANGTSTATAWKHVPQDTNATATAASTVLQSGDSVVFKGGVVYTPAYPSFEPTRANVTFKSDGVWGTGRAIIDGLQQNGTTNTVGFKLSASGIKVDNLEIRNMLLAGVWAYFNNHTITNCFIHTIGPMPWPATTVNGYGNGIFTQGTTNLIVSGCLISNCNFNGIYVSPAGDSVVIHNNEICDINVDAIGYGGATYFLIASNRIHDVKSAVNHGDGMQLLGQYTNQPLVICNNTVWDCTQDIFVEPYCSPLASIVYGESWIFNNVVYNSSPGVNGLQGYANGIVVDNYALTKGVYVFNNTLIDMNSGSGGLRLLQRGSETWVTNFWNINNLYFNSYSTDARPTNGVVNFRSANNLYTNAWRPQFDLATYQSIWPGWETNSVVAPVAFVNYAARNYGPTTSPAIGGGTNLSALVSSSTFLMIPAAFRPDPSKDRNGISRGAIWDIGAYQFVATTALSPPPHNLRIEGSVRFSGSVIAQ